MEPFPLLPNIITTAAPAIFRLIVNSLEAKKEYEAKVMGVDSLADSRRSLLNQLTHIQTRAILELSTQSQLNQILTMSLDLTIQTYKANSIDELSVLQDSSNRINSFLDRYQKDRKHRNVQRAFSVVISVVLFVALLAFAVFSPRMGLDEGYKIPFLNIPLSVLLWSALGSVASMLYRFNKASDAELQDPLRYLITRPLFGVLMGTIVFLAVKIGFLAVTTDTATIDAGTSELVWLMSFLVGFSDRFSDGLLKSMVGKLGGDTTEELIATSTSASEFNIPDTFQSWIKRVAMQGGRSETPASTPGSNDNLNQAEAKPQESVEKPDNNEYSFQDSTSPAKQTEKSNSKKHPKPSSNTIV